ncbi:hypothetical protein GQ43DRAFT_447943 [Delitschia confertaspora ATCC 74209]|uniref:Transcriptional regulatory protein RXT2 N-terminal domain-containing protein n=1 Tax=Delitschia confertaspora ATCC 74209 TaxID=1513339 RepID=A0A9P4MTN0_9PLEO|nr:hypothetical protein GQ43DRAFT_447943 [Delitschia confertaspora ATCC 74209]
MASHQQQLIADTIFNMKRRILRRDDADDTEENETPFNNGRHNLKRKATYTRFRGPESTLEPPPYKKKIDHAGYQRYILHYNPPRYDPDGDIVEPVDEYEDEDELSQVEEDPYSEIHLETGAISRKEQIALAKAKTLQTKLQGDVFWVPHGMLEAGGNLQAPDATHLQDTSSAASGNEDTEVAHGQVLQVNGANDKELPVNGVAATEPSNSEGAVQSAMNGDSHKENGERGPSEDNDVSMASPAAEDGSETASQHTAHRMTTRARAQAVSTPSRPSSPSSKVNPIHPLFTFPTDSLPDRDFGLPPAEAEDTRLLLVAFVQKQEEIARAAQDLHLGMLQGERMRQDVFKWAKAEAHVGEMSDGEDWYDKEEWKLDEDLGKGKDEEEEDTVQQGKKTTRRQGRRTDKDDR